jgi:ketosteroid isomerase-like protein
MRRISFAILILLLAAVGTGFSTAARAADDQKGIVAFNEHFRAVTLRMDSPGLMALWADDGVSLLPGMAPVVGKATITKWLDGVMTSMPGYKVTQQDNDFHDIHVSGSWASEWGTTHQIVQAPDGKPPIEIFGKILLVLHRGEDGQWRIEQEMWNPGVNPATK